MPVLPIGLIFHAELESAPPIGDAEDRTADILWLARTGMFPFQSNKNRRRFRGIELQDDPPLIANARLNCQLMVERRELAVGGIHVKPFLFGAGFTDASIRLVMA